MPRHIGFTSITSHSLHFLGSVYQYIAQCSTLATLYKGEYTVSHYLVFSTFDILYREYRIARDEVLAVFVYGSSGAFNVKVKSATLGHQLKWIVSNTTGIPAHLYKLFYKNQPLDLNSPVGEQLNPGCSIFLHILGKGGGGGNTPDLQGMYCYRYISIVH